MVVSNTRELYRNGLLKPHGGVFISWAIHNPGRLNVNASFFIDLLLDDVVIARWRNKPLASRHYVFVPDWDRIHKVARLTPGEHTVRLVVDPTDLVNETDESDNEYQRSFTWPLATGEATPTAVPSRLPDLAPATPEGWAGPLVATSYPGDTVGGQLSTDVPTYVQIAVINQGLSSTPEDVWGYVYLDGMLVEMRVERGLLAGSTVRTTDWAGLFDAVRVTPGDHTLRVVVDPNDLVVESDESNNSFEIQLTWGAGPVPPAPVLTATAVPTHPAPLALPNLVPAWPFGWDGPIVVSNGTGTHVDTALTIADRPFIDVAVYNRSSIAAGEEFAIDLYFDDKKVYRFGPFGRILAGQLQSYGDWDALTLMAQLSEGAHTLKIVIDPDNAVAEANEDDNVFEKTFVWTKGPVAPPTPTTYTDARLHDTLAGLQSLLDTRRPALSPDGADYTAEVLKVADAGYYLITGKSLHDERVNVFLLTRDQYVAWIDDDFDEEFATSRVSQYPSIMARRERAKHEGAGLKARRFGKVALVINAERGVAEVINTLAHEIGHMRQDFLNPAQTEAPDFFYLQAIQEAEAQQFQRAFWLTLGEFTGLPLLSYPDIGDMRARSNERLVLWKRNASEDEHIMGHLLQWLAALDDPELADLSGELEESGALHAAGSLKLYHRLVSLAPGALRAYVTARLGALDQLFATVSRISGRRLMPDLHPDSEGSPALWRVGLLMP